jgi:uncharacterized protein
MIGINVAQLLQQPQGTVRQFAFDEDPDVLDETCIVGRVRAEGTLTRAGAGVLADCRFETALAGECARCLENAVTPVVGRFQEQFVPTVDVRTGIPLPEDRPDGEEFQIDANHVLDLGEALRQHVLTATPLQPLCRPDCRGLCAQCGCNLNERACNCAPSASGSPFAALKQLLDEPGDQARGA